MQDTGIKRQEKNVADLMGILMDVVCTFAFNEMNNGVTMLFSDIDNLVEPYYKRI